MKPQDLVDREILCNVSCTMDALRQMSEFEEEIPLYAERPLEDIVEDIPLHELERYREELMEYLGIDPDSEPDGRLEWDAEAILEELHYLASENPKEIEYIVSQILNLDWDELSTQEIFEYWAVTEWFAMKLARYDETVFPCPAGDSWWVWGRTTTGAPVCDDYVIQEIAATI